MKKLIILLSIIVLGMHDFVHAADITYMVQIQHQDAGVALPQKAFPTGIAPSDITWSITLKKGGVEVCSKGADDQKGVWNQTGGMLTLNLSLFNSCSYGGVDGAMAGDEVVMVMTINKPGHVYDGASASSTVTVVNGRTLAMGNAGIIFGEPVVVPTISIAGVTMCPGDPNKEVVATITDGPSDMTGYTIDWGITGISTSGVLTSTGGTGAIDADILTETKTGTAKLMKGATVIATSAAYTVTVNLKPTLTLTKDPAVCKGEGMDLTATLNPAGTKFEWKKDGTPTGNGSGTCSTGNLDNPATFTVIGESAAGCKSAPETVTVKVKPIPEVISLLAEKTDACSGISQKLTATTSGTVDKYIWTNASGSASTITVAPTSTTEYSVIAEKDGCKSEEKKVTVTVHTVSVTLTAAPTAVVPGGTSVITATPSFSPVGNTAKNYNWTQGDIAGGVTSGATLSSVTSNALTQTTTFEVEVEDNMGCKGKDDVTVTINGTALEVNPTGGGTYCTADLPKKLNAGATGGTGAVTYTWSSVPAGLDLSSTSVAQPDILASSTEGTYTVSVKVEKGIESITKSLTVTINKTPDMGLASANPSSITEGSASQLTLASVNPTTADLTWSSSNGGPLAGTSGLSVSTGAIATAGTYNYTVTAENKGCKNTATTSVTVTAAGAPLAVNPTGGGTVCTASLPKTLNAGISGGTGALDIEWTVPAGLNLSGNKIENPQVLNTSTPGTYNVSVKVTKGAETKTGTLTLVINKTPELGNISANPSSFAEGGSSTLAVDKVDPTGLTLTWSGGPLAATTGLSVSTGAINTAGSYTYTVTADNATCTAKKTVTVTVTGTTPTPDLVINTPTVPPSGSTNTPIEGSVTVSGGDGDYTYDWSSPDPTVNIVDKGNGNVEITSSTAGPKEVCVEVTDGNGDTDKKCFNVIVTDPSSVNLVMSVDKKCAYPGEFLTLTITGSGADTYSFVLRDKSNNPVMTVTDKTSWDTYKVYTNAEGTYKITDFKYKIGGVESNGTAPAPIEATFNIVPNVYAQEEHLQTINNCQGEQLTLKGTGDPGLQYTWDRGVTDGVPFVPVTTGTYTVTGTNPATGCKNTSTVNVTVNQKPTVTAPAPQEICLGELVTLTASVSTDVVQQPTWNNGVINGQPFKPTITATYEVIAENTAGCTATATTTVTVNQPPHIVRTSRNPRNIAIGKDVYFALTAEGKNLTYQWKKKENGIWVDLADVTNNTPIVIGSKTDSLSLLTVPQSWDGSEFRCVVTGDCGKDSTEFQLGVRECFEIKAELVMYEGIIPDEQPGNNIDGWYCRGQRIALKAIITSDEGYDIEGAHYKWTIDGLDIPEEHIEIESDTAVLTWIPRFTEDDIVVKVCAYSDGACDEACPKYIRLKARDFENVAMRIMTDRDPSHMFCAGDTVNFWLATKNAGLSPKYTWYNDVFELPDEQSPKNELIHYESEKITMVMGQEDTWMRVVMTPSAEICIKEPVVIDTVFMKKKPWVEPFLDIDCADTLVCRGDTVTMQAIYANAGENPTFQWQRSIGDPIKDWDLGTKTYATAYIDEQDVWVKCTMVPSEDVCYDASKPIVDAIKINVMEDNASVTIACDMEDKQSGDELIFEAEVKNILGEPRYEWYVNEMKAPVTESEYITNTLKQGDIVYCLASGERVCQTRVQSNLIVVNYGQFNRDTMLVIYKNESIKDLDMVKEGDNLATVLFKIETSARNGVASISPDGKFSYLPNAGFVGTDDVKYVIINRSDKSVIAEGYIYITVKENDRFFVPNLITPNDDGLNDTWKLDFLSQYPNHIIQVFNRDGIMVYEARNYQNDWKGEGMTKGGYVGHINLVNGIYTYVIDLGDKDKTVLKSWLEIRANLNRRNYR